MTQRVFETFYASEDLALDFKLVIYWSTIDQGAYQTTINGLLTADALPDSYSLQEYTDVAQAR